MQIMKTDISNTWLFVRGKKSEQRGLYNLLVLRKGLTIELVKDCLLEYQRRYISGYKGHSTIAKFTLDCISANFDKFLEIVTEKTSVVFKKANGRKSRHQKDRYDEWFQRSQLDGTFAYNGVTDDF